MKKFEEYNIKYKYLARTDEQEEMHVQDLARDMTGWLDAVKHWSKREVEDAVYISGDHEEWQKFRCSLKGQSTKMKLARLHLYRVSELSKAGSTYQTELVMCRVDNYIGALVRGGQLNSKLEVVR